MNRAQRADRTNAAVTELRPQEGESTDEEDPTRLLRVAPPPPTAPRAARPASRRAKPSPLPHREAPPLTPRELWEGELFLGQYRVERVVGRMGGAVLVKVRHARRGRRLHLKYLAAEEAAKPFAIDAFQRAARAALRLESEHAARTLDAGILACGLPYLVTEAFPGAELREVLRMRGAFHVSDAVDIVLQASHAVAEAHRHGIVHGSLSPSTLFVTRGPDGLSLVKVLELGCSATLRSDPFLVALRNWTEGTQAHWESVRLFDTLAYSAPEQLRGAEELAPALDIWALGAILYELLAGSPPFRAPSATALMAAIVADAPVPPSAFRRDLPRELDAVLLRCLGKAPEARFPSVAALAAALRPFASAEVRATADRVALIHSHDAKLALWARPDRSAPLAEPVATRPRSRRGGAPARHWASSLVFAVLGALGGVLAGTLVARSLTPAEPPVASPHGTSLAPPTDPPATKP